MREPAALIVARDRKLLMIRLELAVETLSEGDSDAARRLTAALPIMLPALGERSSDPRLEEWTTSAETMIGNGVHARYPDVHLAGLTRRLIAISQSAGPTLREVEPNVAAALDSLTPQERQLVETTFTAASRQVEGRPPWIAGLFQHDDSVSSQLLVTAAEADIVARDARFHAMVGGALASTPDDRALLDLGHNLHVRKTRHADRQHVEDWGAIDALAAMPDHDVNRMRSNASHEGALYLNAICDYRLGDFDSCVEQIRKCLAKDADVEEYWQLLAFAERHRGDRAAFERLIYDRSRRQAVIE